MHGEGTGIKETNITPKTVKNARNFKGGGNGRRSEYVRWCLGL
jgi:hypothetical protein